MGTTHTGSGLKSLSMVVRPLERAHIHRTGPWPHVLAPPIVGQPGAPNPVIPTIRGRCGQVVGTSTHEVVSSSHTSLPSSGIGVGGSQLVVESLSVHDGNG